MAYRIIGEGCCEDMCCNECEKKELEIEGGKCITVDKSEEGKYIINSESETIVKSTDGSVDVRYIEGTSEDDCKKVVDLSVDCDDRKVGVCDEDTPGYLKDKVKAISPIYINPICNSNGVLQIGIDEEKLNVKDEKVAVTAGCDGQYLSDALIVNSSYIKAEVNPDTCALVISDKDTGRKPILKVRLESTSIQKQVVAPGGSGTQTDFDYVLANIGSTTTSDVVIPSTYKMELSVGEAMGNGITDGLDSAGRCVIPMDGIYRVTYGGCLEVSGGVIARRTYLYHGGSGSSNVICLESRSGGGNGVLPEDWTYRHPISYSINNPGPCTPSLGRYVARQTFGGSTIVRCNKGDKFMLGIKVSTSLNDPTYDYSLPAEFQIQSRTQQGPGGGDQGAFYTLEWIAPLPS